MLIKILIAVAVIIVVLAVIVTLQPKEFRVARSTSISAPPSAIFAQVNDFHKWAAWNPWGKIDPAMKQTYEGAPAIVTAIYTWAGNNEVGEGRMTLTESRPAELIPNQNGFFKPFAARAPLSSPSSLRQSTAVTWTCPEKTISGQGNALFMNMDTMIGGQFDRGLAAMKSIVEATPKQ